MIAHLSKICSCVSRSGARSPQQRSVHQASVPVQKRMVSRVSTHSVNPPIQVLPVQSSDKTQTLPTVPILSLDGDSEIALFQKIKAAVNTHGFFYVSNTREDGSFFVDPVLTQRVREHAADFFRRPYSEKMALDMKQSHNHRGYFSSGETSEQKSEQPEAVKDEALLVDNKEGLFFGNRDFRHYDGKDGSNLYPDSPGFKQDVEDYMTSCLALSTLIMSKLEHVADFQLLKDFTDPVYMMKILRYPAHDGSCSSHTDFGCLTLLLQDPDTGGLEIDYNGKWIPVPPIKDTFTINIGDMLQMWTNSKLLSNRHRVVHTGSKERISIPFFIHPNSYSKIALKTEQGTKMIDSTDYLLEKYNQTYSYRDKQG